MLFIVTFKKYNMSLNTAHEGYEYQDLLTSFFILKEILNENNSMFKIDVKEYAEEKFDDLTIINSLGCFKKQIKYSNEITNKQLEKEILSSETTYQLALDTLFHSWNNHPDKNNCEVRLCLAWQEPIDELKNILKPHSASFTFSTQTTQIFKVDINKLWIFGQEPLSNWRRFRKESKSINRSEFKIFCNHLVIETNFPKQSSDTNFSGELEVIVLEQIKKLGIGEYPNDKINSKDFAFALMHLVRRSRSRCLLIKTEDIFKELNIQTNFGSIEQVFPIDEQKNIDTENTIEKIKNTLNTENRIILTGEPGSGKSWFVQNLQKSLQSDYKIIKHYCYTELKDSYLKDRITLNIFYGNLINDIISSFPLLKDKKEQRYASNLNELNVLLQNIDEDTLLIVDGLDHIERIYEFSRTDLTLDDVALIQAIKQLNTSEKVKILIVSQPIKELEELSNFKSIEIPSWSKDDILYYLSKNEIKEFEENLISELLLEKSNGNPLYLNYLIEEINNYSPIDFEAFKKLPTYSYNLREYYQYLYEKLNFDAVVPQVLAGANFNLLRNELKEITKQGNKVDSSIAILLPVLKENYSTNGFVIYHESFRRFIIDKLKEDEIDIYHSLFKPLIEWFESKGFYEFPKAYRFYFQLLFNSQKFDEILVYLNNDFISKSTEYGYSFDAVKNNYPYLAKSALRQKDFPKIIQANEINKILNSTGNEYEQSLSIYLTALGYLKGFKKLADYLVFEGEATLPLLSGLEICYLCDQHQEPAPWEIYFQYFKDQDVSLSNFKYYIRKHLVCKSTDILVEIAKITLIDLPEYINILSEELKEYHNKYYIDELIINSSSFQEIINNKPQVTTQENSDLFLISQQILEKKYFSENDLYLIEIFFSQIENNINKNVLVEQVINVFSSKNWFYNWLIFFIKIKLLQEKQNFSYHQVKEAFQFLVYDTDPFKGEPRICDLYSAENYIYNSFTEGLKLLSKKEEWDEILDILVKLSNETTTSLQGSIGGSLSTNKLFQLLDENANDINREKVIAVFEKSILEKENYQFYSYISEYHFRLSKQYSIIGNKEKSEISYKKGIHCLFGYTFRKDMSIEDIVDAIESYASVDSASGNKYLKDMKSLIDAVVHHTDGKGTKWFPIDWFQKFLNINFHDASKYILAELVSTSYYWILEEQLKDLLIKANGEINPIIELFIYRTFPIESSEDFLSYGLTLIDKNKETEYDLAKLLLISLLIKSENKRNDVFKKPFLKKLNNLLSEFKINTLDKNVNLPKSKDYYNKINIIDALKESCISRKMFSDMNIQDKIEYFSKNTIKEPDLIALYYSFEGLDTLTLDIKELIKVIVEKNEVYPKNELDLSIIFQKNNDISAYYWICKFTIEKDGWFRSLYNIESFAKAYSINSDLTIDAITKLSDNLLEIGYVRSFSSNLLNALVKVGYQSHTIKEMWETLYSATEYRLPTKEENNWDELLLDNLDMNTEEILICILFSRFKSNTTDRHHWTLSGLVYLYEYHPEKMIKPTKWFLQNNKHFLTANLLLIIEIIYDISKENFEYHKNFLNELNNLYPSNYYSIDFLLRSLLSRNKIVITHNSNISLNTPNDTIKFFSNINYRNEILNYKGFDFEVVVAKYISSFQNEYAKEFKFLGNNSVKKYVNNIYPSNYLLKLINECLYSEFSECYNADSLFFDVLKINYKLIVAQTNSYQKRPSDLIKPSTIIEDWQKNEVIYSEWVRLGYYEYEIHEKKYGETEECNVLEGIVFNSKIKKTRPFSRYSLYPQHIFDNMPMSGIDEYLCLNLIQQNDNLENYKILWINSNIINNLNLKVDNFLYGLSARNENNEIVLKYNHWCCDYLGNESISDEIPKLEGSELICRRDYFEKICKLFGDETPYLYTLKQ